MTEINQIFYLIFGIVAISIGYTGHLRFRSEKSYFSSEIYWVFFTISVATSSFLFVLAPVSSYALITLANTFTLIANFSLLLLLRSFRRENSNRLIVAFLIYIPVFMIIFEVLRQNDNFVARVFLVTISLVFISVFQVVECFKLIRHDRSIHLKAIVFFVIILSTFIGLRFFKALKVTDPQTGYLYQEVGLAFYLRIITYAIYLLIIISISNYFYEKLWFRADALAHLNEDKMLMSLKQLALARDNETGQHVVRTQNYVKALAQRLTRMGYFTNELSENAVELLFKAAPLHDIGKVGIPDKILLKKGKLTPAEWEIMKTHTLIGESVLSSAGLSIEQDAYEDVIEKAIKIAGGHHEKWDGTGYPRALVGEQIPLEARIMAIADMYDALVSERVYKKAWLHEDAVNEILYKKGTHFDPKVVDAFLLESHRFREIAEEFRD